MNPSMKLCRIYEICELTHRVALMGLSANTILYEDLLLQTPLGLDQFTWTKSEKIKCRPRHNIIYYY